MPWRGRREFKNFERLMLNLLILLKDEVFSLILNSMINIRLVDEGYQTAFMVADCRQ